MSGVFKTTTVVGRKVEKASRSEQQQPTSAVQSCPNKNWIDLYYKYNSDRPVALADYLITDEKGQKIASGKLDNCGFAHVPNLPDGVTSVNITYTSDPRPFEIFNDKKPIKNPYLQAKPQVAVKEENAFVAAFKEVSQPVVSLAVAYHEFQLAAGEWTWGAIQGDWNEDQTLGQIIFDSAVSLIPFVDQAADVRDISANLYQLIVKKKYDEFGPWFGLVMTVIGCIPEVGTAIKGAVKSVVKVGKEAAKNLIVKSGIDIGKLIRFMNHFGEGNVVKWLREQIGKFDDYTRFISLKIKEILIALKFKCLELRGKLFSRAQQMFDELVINNIEEVFKRVDKFVKEIMGRTKKELEDVTKPKDYSIKGVTQTENGAKQIAEPPPLAPALERHKKRLLEINEAAKRAGMEPDELKGLVKNSKDKGRRTVVRFTNDKALDFHGREGYLPKSVDVKLKTAKDGPNAGLVVKPKGEEWQWEEWERQNVRYLQSKGYEWDEMGRLIDKDGNRYYGDYDLQAVHRQVEDGDGKKIFVNESSDPDVIDDINSDMERPGRPKGQDKPIQHGAENDFHVRMENGDIKVDPKYGKTEMASEEEIMSGKATLGKQYGDDEKYLVVNPDGSIEILENPDALYNMYRKEGDELPWNYNSKPPTGEELKAEQARRKAKKEEYERAAAAEAKAEKEQMEMFINDIIGDGTHFVERPSNYVQLVPTPF